MLDKITVSNWIAELLSARALYSRCFISYQIVDLANLPLGSFVWAPCSEKACGNTTREPTFLLYFIILRHERASLQIIVVARNVG